MPKFTVHFERTARLAVTVEADDAEQAEEKSLDVFPASPIDQYCACTTFVLDGQGIPVWCGCNCREHLNGDET